MQAADLSRNRQEYDLFWSQVWRRTWTYASQTKVRRFRAIVRRYQWHQTPRLRVFDQGFGLGLMLFCFRHDAIIAGTELSAQAVASARERAHARGYRNVDLRRFEPEQPVPPEWNGTFDIVISSHVLEHIADPSGPLQQMVAMLKPGGHIVILVPINERPGEDLNHFHWFSRDSLRNLVRQHRCEVLEASECDRLYRLIMPLSLARQRCDTRLLQVISKVVNGLTAPLPLPFLRLSDILLSVVGVKPTQCVLVARKAEDAG